MMDKNIHALVSVIELGFIVVRNTRGRAKDGTAVAKKRLKFYSFHAAHLLPRHQLAWTDPS